MTAREEAEDLERRCGKMPFGARVMALTQALESYAAATRADQKEKDAQICLGLATDYFWQYGAGARAAAAEIRNQTT